MRDAEMDSGTSQGKRKRGRPKGSGGRDDSATLRRIVADMVGNPALKPVAAMRRVCGSISETDTKRLRRKLRTQGPALRAEELNRVQRAREAVGVAVGGLRRYEAAIQVVANSPVIKAMEQFRVSPEMQAMMNQTSAALTAERFRVSPEMKRWAEAVAAVSAEMQAMMKLTDAALAVTETQARIKQTNAALALIQWNGCRR